MNVLEKKKEKHYSKNGHVRELEWKQLRKMLAVKLPVSRLLNNILQKSEIIYFLRSRT